METLRYIRRLNHLTLKELATKLGIGESTISLYETGKRFPDNQIVEKLSELFNVPTTFIRGEGVFSNWNEYVQYMDKIAENLKPLLKNFGIQQTDMQLYIALIHAVVTKITVIGNTIEIHYNFNILPSKGQPESKEDQNEVSCESQNSSKDLFVTTAEQKHLKKYRILNEIGREKINEQIDDMLTIPKYTEEKQESPASRNYA